MNTGSGALAEAPEQVTTAAGALIVALRSAARDRLVVNGADLLLVDAEGRSRISYADFAIAFVSELESGRHVRQVITAAY